MPQCILCKHCSCECYQCRPTLQTISNLINRRMIPGPIIEVDNVINRGNYGGRKLIPNPIHVDASNHNIFIQLPSYRDPELINTIDDAIDKAFSPNNLIFGICWQHGDDENLDKYKNDPRFKIIDVPYHQSKGVGWARYEIQKLYTNEKYTLQLDSHHRFVKDWDIILIVMLEKLKLTYPKPIITTYGAPYEASYRVCSSNDEQISDPSIVTKSDCQGPSQILTAEIPCKINSDGFRTDGSIKILPEYIQNFELYDKPIKARFLSAHFMFSDGKICLECPSDPDIYFDGEEITRTVRCYTMGYDLFCPNIHIIWHEYTRNYRKKHWDDHTQSQNENDIAWYKRDELSKKKMRKLLEMEDNEIDLQIFGLGRVRSLQDYENFSNINFKNRTVGPF